ncbi:hypothetical protein [Reichenbachiella sp.]|uniref:hypothetical protein n=1 Tax=Reichenbachiella sp. TaxID=2184521 RepID=UPI003B58F332
MKTKLKIMLAIFLFGSIVSQAQSDIQVSYSEKGFSSSLKKLQNKKSYRVKLVNVHSALMSLESEVISYDLESSTPDAVKFLSIPSTASLNPSSGFRIVKNGQSEVRNNLMQLVNLINTYDAFYKEILKRTGEELEKWPKSTLDSAKLKRDYIAISNQVFNRVINKDEISKIKFLLQEIDIWASYVNSLAATKDAIFLSNLDVYAKFMASRALLKENSSKYVKCLLVYDAVLNPADISKVSILQGDSFVAKGDLTKIKIAVKNEMTKDTIAVGTLSIPTYKYFTFDFSAGFFGNGLTNDSFSLVEYSADSSTITFKKDYNDSNDIAAGGLLHLSYMATGVLGVGINTGAAISLYDGSIKYLAGGHLKIGNQKQLMLSCGVSVGKVKRLSEAVTSDPLYMDNSESVVVPGQYVEPKLVDKIETSMFIGLSYNLSGVLTKRK